MTVSPMAATAAAGRCEPDLAVGETVILMTPLSDPY